MIRPVCAFGCVYIYTNLPTYLSIHAMRLLVDISLLVKMNKQNSNRHVYTQKKKKSFRPWIIWEVKIGLIFNPTLSSSRLKLAWMNLYERSEYAIDLALRLSFIKKFIKCKQNWVEIDSRLNQNRFKTSYELQIFYYLFIYLLNIIKYLDQEHTIRWPWLKQIE